MTTTRRSTSRCAFRPTAAARRSRRSPRPAGRIALKRGSKAVALSRIAYFWLRSAGNETGYVVVPRSFHDGTEAEVVKPGKQSSAPAPGLTLLLRLAADDRTFDTRKLAVVMAVADTATTAESVAKQLGASV